MSIRVLLSVLAVVMSLMLALLALASCSENTGSDPTGTVTQDPTRDVRRVLAVAGIRDSDANDVFILSADGKTQDNLTANDSDDIQPAWSPDGQPLAFAGDRTGNFDIYVMKADGSNVVQLTRSPAEDTRPVWSRDGSQIAYSRQDEAGQGIRVMNSDGSEDHQVTTALSDAYPEIILWSTDGSELLFVSDQDGNSEIYAAKVDGSSERNLTENKADDILSSISPDGKSLLLASDRDGNVDIYSMSFEGEVTEKLTDNDGFDFAANWSPDATNIAFVSDSGCDVTNNPDDQSCPADLFVLESTNLRRLTRGLTGLQLPIAWSPDGGLLAFVADDVFGPGVIVMNLDSGESASVSELYPFPCYLDWQPE
jgi:Tol biopolymer transport system component